MFQPRSVVEIIYYLFRTLAMFSFSLKYFAIEIGLHSLFRKVIATFELNKKTRWVSVLVSAIKRESLSEIEEAVEPLARVPTVFLILPNFHSCFYYELEISIERYITQRSRANNQIVLV